MGRKTFRAVMMLAIAVALLMAASPAMAGSMTVTWDRLSKSIKRCNIKWSGTSDSGTIPEAGVAGMVLYAEVIPSGSPTADYDITITNSDGIDLFDGQLGDLSSSASARIEPVVPYVYWSGSHTFTWSNQSAANASGKVRIYIRTP